MDKQPRKYQRRALRYSERVINPALFMEMRLGKTLVAVHFLKPKLDVRRILVIAPIPALMGWEEELLSNKESNCCLLMGKAEERLELANKGYRWNLINFEGLLACREIVHQMKWDAVIVDESPKIKNPKSKISKLIVNNFRDVKHRLILTGKPDPEGPMDYFSQMKFLDGEFMGCDNFWTWRKKYFFNPFLYEWKASKKTKRLIRKAIQERAFCLTREEAGIKNQKVYQKRFVVCSPDWRKAYEEVEKEFAITINGETKTTKWVTTKFLWMARIAGGFLDNKTLLNDAKLQEILSLLQTELKGEKVVIWFRFRAELKAMKKVLKDSGFSFSSITGGTAKAKRRQRVKAFQAGKKQVMLSIPSCSKYGMDLSAADTAIYYSNPYSFDDRSQSEDRILDVRKKKPLLYIDLVTADTVDEDVSKVLKEKGDSSRYFLERMKELSANRISRRGVRNVVC